MIATLQHSRAAPQYHMGSSGGHREAALALWRGQVAGVWRQLGLYSVRLRVVLSLSLSLAWLLHIALPLVRLE
jgi:hypothetical protein